MRLARRAVLVCSAAALLVSLGASAASADALRQGGAVVATPFAMGSASTNVVFNGVFAQPISCTNTSMNTNVTVNNMAGVPATGNLTGWAFAGCTMPGPIACNISANNLPWAGAVSLDVGAPKTYSASFPANGSLTITCFPAGGPITCTYVGAGAAPPSSVQGLWTDSTPGNPARFAFVNEPLARIAPSAGACGAAPTYSGAFFTTQNSLTLTV
jgi:hypothetical protein